MRGGHPARAGVRGDGERDPGRVAAALAAGDRDTYRDLQRQVYEAYTANVPIAVSHRAKNDSGYLAAYANFMAEFALARAFDPAAQSLEAR